MVMVVGSDVKFKTRPKGTSMAFGSDMAVVVLNVRGLCVRVHACQF